MLLESTLFCDFLTVDLRSVNKLDSDGHLVEIAILRRGRVFGEMAVLVLGRHGVMARIPKDQHLHDATPAGATAPAIILLSAPRAIKSI